MWSYLYIQLRDRKIEKHLFDMLEMFVLKGQIVSIPEHIFLEMVSYYSQKGNEVVIEKLVLSNR